MRLERQTNHANLTDWTCAETVADPFKPPWGVGNLTLPICKPGLCTSVPTNASQYLAMGGNEEMGGNWTDGDGPCPLKGLPPKRTCDNVCTGLLLTGLREGGRSHWRDCHFADAPSPSVLKHLIGVEGGQQSDSLANG